MFFNKNNEQLSISEQAFSSTDLAKNKEVGIVFPIKEADKNTINVASIIDRRNGEAYLKHTEARLVSSDEENVYYEKGKTITYIEKVIHNSEVDIDLLGLEPSKDLSYFTSKDIKETTPLFNKIAEFWHSIDFKPMVFIDDKLISKKEVKVTQYDKPIYNFPVYGKSTTIISKKDLENINKYVSKFIKCEGDAIVDMDKFLTFTKEEKTSYLSMLEEILNIYIDEDMVKLATTSDNWKDLYSEVLEDLLFEVKYQTFEEERLV